MRRTAFILKSCVLVALATLPGFGQSTELTVGDEYEFICNKDRYDTFCFHPFSNAEFHKFCTAHLYKILKIKAQSFDNGNTIKCRADTAAGGRLLRSNALVVRPNAAIKDEFEPGVVQQHVFREGEQFELSCRHSMVGWIKVDANNVVTDGDTHREKISKNFTLTAAQFDGAKLICLHYDFNGEGRERIIQKVVAFRLEGEKQNVSSLD